MRTLIACLCFSAGSVSAADPVMLFDGKSLDGWTLKSPEEKSHWTVGAATMADGNPKELTVGKGDELVNAKGGGVDIYSDKKFGDCIIELEFMVPKDSNSGIYVMGEYEVQILDSYGVEKLGPGDVGAIYGASVPTVNASKKPGEWQKFTIHFRAPRFENGKKTENARFVLVELNDQILHKDIEVKGPTPSCLTGKESPEGPLLFQGDHGPVAYRDIRITPTKFD